MSIFSYKDYRRYLEAWIRAQPRRGRGIKLRLAAETGMQASFLSSVLKGRMHFSIDQAFAISNSLGLAEVEQKFFLLLVQYARAATPGLREHLKHQLEEEKRKSENLASRLADLTILDDKGMQEYFSTWTYSAVHLACLIDQFRGPDAIAARLGLERKNVLEILGKLESMGIVEKTPKGYVSGRMQLHLPKGSLHLRQHQMNLKAKAMEIAQKGPEGLQYISMVSISKDDYSRIFEKLVELLKDTRPIINSSPAEDLYIFNLDFTRLM